MPEHEREFYDMLFKLIGIVFVALVFLGLGVSGTFNAALAGYHTMASNTVIHQFQNKVTSAIKNETTTQIHNMENVASQVRSSKIQI